MKRKILLIELILILLIIGLIMFLKLGTIKLINKDGTIFNVRQGDCIETDVGKIEIIKIKKNGVTVKWSDGKVIDYEYNREYEFYRNYSDYSNSNRGIDISVDFPVETLIFEK